MPSYINMAGKKPKKSTQRKKSTDSSANKKSKGQKKPAATKSRRSEGRSKSSKSRYQLDIFNEHCMENAYYICHNVQDLLKCRGFPWPDAQNKKKKGKKK